MMFNNLPVDNLVLMAIFLVQLFCTFKVARHVLAFMHLLAAQTRMGVLEFMDHVAYNTLYELGEVRKIEQIPVTAFGVLFWAMLWVSTLYAFITYILVFMG
ncbi:MAG: hypothetical protein ACRCTP_04155 [Aeromonas popoffii]|uniref:hypothetical protein n=1 Tax=Aeromonas popoffii TaxID=70856 RepID=UPI003F3EA34F